MKVLTSHQRFHENIHKEILTPHKHTPWLECWCFAWNRTWRYYKWDFNYFVSLVPPHQYQVLWTYLSSQRPRSDFTLIQRSDQDLKGFTFSSKLFSAAVTSKMQIGICNNSHQLWHQINWRNVQLQKCFKLWCKRCFFSSWLPYSADK